MKTILLILLFLTGIILVIFAFKKYYKYLVQEKVCKEKILGVVTGYTLVSRSGGKFGVFPPIVSYTVNGKEYKVIGPEYKNYKIKTIYTNMSSGDDVETNQVGETLYITQRLKSVFLFENPMRKIYPLGMQLNVYYNPKNPSNAYVERYCNKKDSFYLILISSIIIFSLFMLTLILF